jgi:hypothetical protein
VDDSFPLIVRPDPDDAEAAEVYVEASVGAGDKANYLFLLDTGAARTCLPLDEYTATFAHVGQSNPSALFAAGSEDRVIAPSIQLGPIRKTDLTVARLREKRPELRSLIGMDMLRDFVCHFRFDANLVQVLQSGQGESIGAHDFEELRFDRIFHPYVHVRFPDLVAQAVWDTGAGITVVDLGFIRRNSALFREVGSSQGTDASGSSMETPMFVMEASTIGGKRFPSHRVAGVDLSQVNATIDMPMDMILGYSTLSKANWLFDFPGGKWAVTEMISAGGT